MEIEYWNGVAGARWAESRAQIDANLAAITELALSHAAPMHGERVVDVGCGCGTTTFALRQLVGPTGAACGIDVSAPMLDVARQSAGGTDVTFVEADAATYKFTFTFDLVFSRFGVMFFADPAAAFANLRTALAPGGRIAFVCWRAPADNPWATVPVATARDLLPADPPADPTAPGPFSFADPSRIEDILRRADLRDIAIGSADSTVVLGSTIEDAAAYLMVIGPLARRAGGLDDAVRLEIVARLRRELASYVTPAGIALRAAVWLVSARI